MARVAGFILLILFALHLPSEVHANAKAAARFKQYCEEGSGKACFDYGNSLWAPRANAASKSSAMHYYRRACELKYKAACQVVRNNSTKAIHLHKNHGQPEGVGEICFTNPELQNARLTPNALTSGATHGQLIDSIKPNTFWDRAGLKDNDIIVRVNNMPFNNPTEVQRAFSTSGKKFGFEVIRQEETITLWYSCK